MQTPPKPSMLLIAVSWVIVAVCLFLVSTAIGIIGTWETCSLFTGLILLPLPVVLGIQQYRGTFRQVRGAAMTAAVLLFAIGGFAALILVVLLFAFGGFAPLMFVVMTAEGVQIRWPSLIVVAVAFSSIVAGRMNRRWARSLPALPRATRKTQFTVRELFGAVSAIAVIIAVVSSIVRSSYPKHAEHVERADAPFFLPDGATDVSYHRTMRFGIECEFTIDESGFRQWVDSGKLAYARQCKAANVRLLPITTPVLIKRYNGHWITVHSGLHYSWSPEDEHVVAVFDSTTNRAYYSCN
jgi:hypothetical protein